MPTPRRHHSIPPVLPPANCFTVLVIDDMAPNRKLLGKFLEASGYAVVEAINGVEALELLRGGRVRPNLIVTDVEMPVMDGITMVEKIRIMENSLSEVPIITASGNADREMKRSALAAGSDVFLTKPFDLRELRGEIATLLKSTRRPFLQKPLQGTELGGNRFDSSLKLNS